MIRPPNEGVEIYLCVEPVDFRRQANGLAALVESELQRNAFSTQLFVFSNRRKNQCRILVWERNGFVLWSKRLEKNRFPWPRGDEEVLSLTGRELNLLLDGYDIFRFKPHPALAYTAVY
jgi:transposase